MSKKDTELKIFKLLYRNQPDIEYEHKDKPDFWVTNKFGLRYGIEITELFDNESEARISKIPNYIDDLFDKKGYRHKDDKININIQDITLLSKDNISIATVPAVVYQQSDVRAYLSILEKCIEEKTKLINSYNPELAFHSLIIKDQTHALVGRERKHLFNLMYRPELIALLKRTDFREIYLIRHDKDGYFVTPLKGFLFLSRLYLLHDLLTSSNTACNEIEFHNYFAELLEFDGFSGVRLLINDDTVDVVYGSYSIGVRNLKSIVIKDYSQNQPEPSSLSVATKSSFLSKEMINSIHQMMKTFGIEGEFSFSLKESEH